MKDVELLALAALVNAYAAETNAANDDRKHHGQAMCYAGFAGADSFQALENEMFRRGVLGGSQVKHPDRLETAKQ